PSLALLQRWETREETAWLELPCLRDYRPSKAWHDDVATEKQLVALRGYGFEVLRDLTKGEASHLINCCDALDQQYPTPATPKQQWLLQTHGRWRPGLSKHQAQRLIGKILSGAL